MNFNTDLSKLLLLGNKTIHIFLKDKVINFNAPSLELLYSLDFIELKNILEIDYTTLKNIPAIVANQYEFFLAYLKESGRKDILLENFNKVFPSIKYSSSQLFCNNIPLTSDEFDLLINFIKVSCGEKDLSILLEEPKEEKIEESKPLTEFQKLALKMKGNEERLKKMKEKSNKKGSSADITIDQIVIAIIYEFPSLKIEDIFQMNLYSILELWKYVSKVIDTQIQITAAGNGLIKNFTYFIN